MTDAKPNDQTNHSQDTLDAMRVALRVLREVAKSQQRYHASERNDAAKYLLDNGPEIAERMNLVRSRAEGTEYEGV